MSIQDQLASMRGTLATLKELLPRHDGEHFTMWVRRGLAEGLLTHDEAESLTRLFVYDGTGVEAALSAA